MFLSSRKIEELFEGLELMSRKIILKLLKEAEVLLDRHYLLVASFNELI